MINKFRSAATLVRRFGILAPLHSSISRILERIVGYRRFNVIILERGALRPFNERSGTRLSSRLATRGDLESLIAQGDWGITEEKLAWMQCGYLCFLCEVDGRTAGYTWAHDQETAELIQGLSISVPPDLIYNFDGFTHPDYRGFGLQGFRHHSVLGHSAWDSKRGLLGYVVARNYSSRKGQAKSGYSTIGVIRMMKLGERLLTFFSSGLGRLGIRRSGHGPGTE